MSELVLFTIEYKVNSFRLPKLWVAELKLSDNVKYLGICLDYKLCWKWNTPERLIRCTAQATFDVILHLLPIEIDA